MRPLGTGKQLFSVGPQGPMFVIRAVEKGDKTGLQQLAGIFDDLRSRLAAAEEEREGWRYMAENSRDNALALLSERDALKARLDEAVAHIQDLLVECENGLNARPVDEDKMLEAAAFLASEDEK